MNFFKNRRLLAEAKSQTLLDIGHATVNLITDSKVKEPQMLSHGALVKNQDMLNYLKHVIRQGNGHIAKIELSKPMSNHSFPDQTHTIEIAFQGIDTSPKVHIGPQDEYARFVGKVNDIVKCYPYIEQISKLMRDKTAEFTLSFLDTEKMLNYPKASYNVSYSHGGSIIIKNSLEGFVINEAIELNHSFGSHSQDRFVLNPKYYDVKSYKEVTI